MPTIYTTFAPSPVGPFSFTPILDGGVGYNLSVPWLLYGARFYFTLSALDGTWIITTGLSASPVALTVQSASWAQGIATLITANPHGYRIGAVVTLTVAGMAPDVFNGLWQMVATGRNTLAYSLAGNPGPVTAFGRVSADLNIVAGVVNPNTGAPIAVTSSIVFREQTMQFETTVLTAAQVAAAAAAQAGPASGIFILGKSTLGGPNVLS